MREKADTEEDSAPAVKRGSPWSVTNVQALANHRLSVRFADGTRGEVDIRKLVFGADPGVFAALRNPDTFARAHIVHGAVTWPGELDLAPDAMYEAIKANGFWAPQ